MKYTRAKSQLEARQFFFSAGFELKALSRGVLLVTILRLRVYIQVDYVAKPPYTDLPASCEVFIALWHGAPTALRF